MWRSRRETETTPDIGRHPEPPVLAGGFFFVWSGAKVRTLRVLRSGVRQAPREVKSFAAIAFQALGIAMNGLEDKESALNNS